MASYNRVILIGNLTRDPEVRYLPSGMAVCDIGLAVNDRRKDAQTGQWVEQVTFVDVTLWGRTAEVAGEYLSKGSPTFIEGRLKLDSWETQDGQKRNKLKVVAERMQLIGSRGGGQADGQAPQGQGGFGQQSDGFGQQSGGYGQQQQRQPPPPQQQQADGGQQDTFSQPPSNDFDDGPSGPGKDIPF